MIAPLPDTAYWRAYEGRFQGILTWQALGDFWQVLAASGGEWYVFYLDRAPPASPVSGAAFDAALAQILRLYDDVRDRSYCGAVYVDDPAAPGFVKLFDPWKMGAACGASGSRVLPRYALSRIPPDPLPDPAPDPEPSLFARLLARSPGGR